MSEKTNLKPDTLDLTYNARLSINHLTRNLDPKRGYLPYFWSIIEKPVRAEHFVFDYGDITGRYVDALILTRLMTGDHLNAKIEETLKKRFLYMFNGPNGLCYREDTPFSKRDAIIFDQSRALMGLTSWYLQKHNSEVKKYIDSLVHGLFEIADKKEGYLTIPYRAYPLTGWDPDYDGGVAAKGKSNPAYEEGPLIRPLVRIYKETGNEEALELAEGLVARILEYTNEFNEDGSFEGHFHVHAATVAGIFAYGLITRKEDLKKWAVKVYEFMKSEGSRFGWFPNRPSSQLSDTRFAGCESCIITDVIDTAILLAKNGYEQYWNDVERFARNHLVEAQLKNVSWIPPSSDFEDTDTSSFRDIPERIKGGFAGWSAPNDFIGPNPKGEPLFRLMNCCSGAGGHGLYLVWSNIATKTREGVFVNLAMNRDTKWVEILSYRPYLGKISIRVNDAPAVYVRIPDWVDKDDVTILVNGTTKDYDWKDSYLKVTNLHKGDELVVTYPLRLETVKEKIKGFKDREFTVKWRGDTVVDIKPIGIYHPLYQRNHMDTDSVPMKKAKYYVPTKEIQW